MDDRRLIRVLEALEWSTRRTMQMAALLIVCLVMLIGGLLLAACHPLPPNAQIAKTAGDIVGTVNTLAREIVSLPISDDTKAPYIIKANRIQSLGPKLADALDAYDTAAAADKAVQAGKVQIALDEIQAVVNSLKLPSDSVWAKATNLVTSLLATFLKIRTSLSLPPGPVADNNGIGMPFLSVEVFAW